MLLMSSNNGRREVHVNEEYGRKYRSTKIQKCFWDNLRECIERVWCDQSFAKTVVRCQYKRHSSHSSWSWWKWYFALHPGVHRVAMYKYYQKQKHIFKQKLPICMFSSDKSECSGWFVAVSESRITSVTLPCIMQIYPDNWLVLVTDVKHTFIIVTSPKHGIITNISDVLWWQQYIGNRHQMWQQQPIYLGHRPSQILQGPFDATRPPEWCICICIFVYLYLDTALPKSYKNRLMPQAPWVVTWNT